MKMILRSVIALLALLPIVAHGTPEDTQAQIEELLSDIDDFAELSLEDLLSVEVITASRHAQRTDEAPSTVTVITAEEIASYGYETLADLLWGVAGIHITNDRNYQYAGIHGLVAPGDYNTRMLILLDGHPINELVWSSAGIGTDGPIDLDLVDRVEVLRGPGSALYGTSAILGVVQIVTRRPGGDDQGLGMFQAAAGTGSFDRRSGLCSWSVGLPQSGSLRISASGMESDGPQLFYQEFAKDGEDGITEGTDFDRYARFSAQVEFERLRVSAHHFDRTKGVPTAPWEGTFGDPATRTRDARGFVDLSYALADREGFRLDAGGHLDWSIYEGYWPYDEYEEEDEEQTVPYLSKESSGGTWYGGDLNLDWKLGRKHRLLAGGEFRLETVGLEFEDVDRSSKEVYPYADFQRDCHFAAVYLQDEFRPIPWMGITAGLHYDWYHIYAASMTPRLGLVVNPDRKTVIKLLYGRGFRVPSLAEMEYTDYRLQLSNPDLDPEKSWTMEAVFERTWVPHIWSRLLAYHTDVEGIITLAERDDGYLQYQNQGEARLCGAEMETRMMLAHRVETRASVSYQDNEDDLGSARNTNSPRWMGKLGVAAPIVGRHLRLGLEGRFVDERYGIHEGAVAGSYVVADANLSWITPVQGLAVSFKIINLGDNAYEDPAGEEHVMPTIRQDGRTWRIKIRYGFDN